MLRLRVGTLWDTLLRMVKNDIFTVGIVSKYEILQHHQQQGPSDRTAADPQPPGSLAGDRVEFVVEGERTVLRPARAAASPFDKYKGTLGTFPGGEKEINAWLRELRTEERGRK